MRSRAFPETTDQARFCQTRSHALAFLSERKRNARSDSRAALARSCEIEAYEEQSKSSDASTRHHSQQKLEEYRDKKRRLMVELNKCDEKLLFAQLEEPPEPQAQDPPAHYPNDDVQMTDA